MVKFLNFLSYSSPTHEPILFIILLKVGILLSPSFMRCTLVYILLAWVEVLSFVTCGQARLVVSSRIGRISKATIHFGIETGRSFRSWWMKTLHLWLLGAANHIAISAILRRPAQIHRLPWHHPNDIVLTCVDSLVPCCCSTPQIVLIIELSVALGSIGVIKTGLPPAGSLRHRPVTSLITLDVAWDADGGWCVHDLFNVIGLVKGCTTASILGIHIIVIGHESIYLSLILAHIVVALIAVLCIISCVLNPIDVTWLLISILSLWVVGIPRGVLLWTRAVDVTNCANLASADHPRWLCVLT